MAIRVAVAGAKGFIGRVIARSLRAAHHDVVEVGRQDRLDRADVLVWAAGKRELTREENRSVHVFEMLAAAERCDRVVYLSSGEVYGSIAVPFRESSQPLGMSEYAQAKLEAERALVRKPSTVLRLGVVYGPDQAPQMLIPKLVKSLRAGEHIALTHGEQTRDFIYVEDVAGAVVAAVEREPADIVNVASGLETRVRDACLAIARVLGAPESLLGFGELPPRENEQERYVLDISVAERVLGWRPTTTLAEGVARL